MTLNDPKRLMTAAEAAQYLNLRESRIRYETFLKRIPHLKIGRSVRYTQADLDAWLSGLKQEVQATDGV